MSLLIAPRVHNIYRDININYLVTLANFLDSRSQDCLASQSEVKSVKSTWVCKVSRQLAWSLMDCVTV